MKNLTIEELKNISNKVRFLIIRMIKEAGQGHIGGSLSIADLLTILYFNFMNVDVKNPKLKTRDKLVLSKGHAGPSLYATLALKGFFELPLIKTLNKPKTNLPSHVDMNKTKGVDFTCGSLGQGISAAVGIALADKLADKLDAKSKNKESEKNNDNSGNKKTNQPMTFAIIGDGEIEEGSCYEAMMSACKFNLDNLIIFLDNNGMQIDGTTEEIMPVADHEGVAKSFGFDTYSVDGHNYEEIISLISNLMNEKNNKPKFVVLNTIKGKGISFIEKLGVDNHSTAVDEEMVNMAKDELGISEDFIKEIDS